MKSSFSYKIQTTAVYRLFSICLHHKKIEKAIKQYRPKLKSGEKLGLSIRLIWLYTFKMWAPDEYFINDYEHMSKADRRDFVPDNEYLLFMESFVREEACEISGNKWNSYRCMGEYYKRNAFLIPAKPEAEFGKVLADFRNFISLCNSTSHNYIIKPLAMECGIGVRLLKVDDNIGEDFLQKLMNEYPEGAIVEEVISQSEELGRFHPQSVNTVRINTIRTDNEVHVFLPYLRIGRSGKIIDNTNNGGILSSFDPKTGVLDAAMDINNNVFPVHPDTNCNIEGEQIPRWNEAKQLAIEMANKFKYTRLVGWDLALSDKGWVVVEFNSRPGIAIVQRHFRQEFEWLKRQHYTDC